MVAALASWLDARAHGGQWLVRIEDVDTPRTVPGAADTILQQLAQCGLVSDAPVLYQSQRSDAYASALRALLAQQRAYWCRCSRSQVLQALHRLGQSPARHAELAYPGTCRNAGLQPGLQPLAGRFRLQLSEGDMAERLMDKARITTESIADAKLHWHDRWLGGQFQNVARAVGDFVLRRADGCYSYQLAVVLDDAAQGITHVVRGADLADNTPRQILLQRALGLPLPQYLHTPLVLGADGEKLSKQNGASALDCSAPLPVLRAAARVLGLGLEPQHEHLDRWLAAAIAQWAQRFVRPCTMEPQPNPYNPRPVNPLPATPTPLPASSPEEAAAPERRPIRSFVMRAGRTTAGQARALSDIGPQFLVPYQSTPLNIDAAFAQATATLPGAAEPSTYDAPASAMPRPRVLEIGFGMGEATAHIAAALPGTDFLCCEVHPPGVGALLKRISEQNLRNIRIVAHDAVEVIDNMLPPWDAANPDSGLDGIHVFFPDPWHKKRHHKRRLLQSALVARLAARLKPGGYIHCATDWQEYAEQILQVLRSEPLLRNTAPATGYAERPWYRPLTKFERRGLRLGHGVWDLVFTRN